MTPSELVKKWRARGKNVEELALSCNSKKVQLSLLSRALLYYDHADELETALAEQARKDGDA